MRLGQASVIIPPENFGLIEACAAPALLRECHLIRFPLQDNLYRSVCGAPVRHSQLTSTTEPTDRAQLPFLTTTKPPHSNLASSRRTESTFPRIPEGTPNYDAPPWSSAYCERVGSLDGRNRAKGAVSCNAHRFEHQANTEIISDIILQPASYPLMIMCNLGRHRTGTVVGCLRKLQRWNLASIFEEYRRHAGARVKVMNEQVCAFLAVLIGYRCANAPSTVYRALRHGQCNHSDGADRRGIRRERDGISYQRRVVGVVASASSFPCS